METSEKVVLKRATRNKRFVADFNETRAEKRAKKKLSDCIDINTDFKNGLRDQS